MSAPASTFRRPRRALAFAVGLLSLWLAGTSARAQDMRPAGLAAPQPMPTLGGPAGRLIDIDGHRIHIWCIGRGRPAVLLEAGLGANHLDWIRVQPPLSASTMVCSYDRAGYGWSEAGPKPRTLDRVTGELRALLAAAGVPTPVVFAGHSFGGLVGMAFAERYPEAVAGLVLVDSMHPQQYERFAARGVDVPTEPNGRVIYQSPELLAGGIPAEYRPLALRLAEGDRPRSFMYSELRNVKAGMAAMKPLARLEAPVRVLVHGRRDWDGLYPDGRMERIWTDLQDDASTRLGGRPATVVPGTSHQIHLDDPSAVLGAIGEVVQAARAARPQWAARDMAASSTP